MNPGSAQAKVLFLPEVRNYFQELSVTLYQKHYFSFFENALRYADELFSEIEINLPNKHKREAAKHFDKYGKEMYYTTFRKIKIPSGMYFSTSIIPVHKPSILLDISAITT